MSNKILITADIHFGLEQKLNDILWAVRTMREYAAQNGINEVYVLGDLFHDREKLNIEVLSSVYRFLDEAKEKYAQKWTIFPGNHDMYLRHSWDISALNALNKVSVIIDNIKLLNISNRRFWIVPFIQHEQSYMKIINSLESKYKDGDILLTHIGVNSASLNVCYLLKNWNIVDFSKSKFNTVISGHFHCHQNAGRGNVWYPGSPIPFRFDEGMVPHGFIEFNIDDNDIKFIEIFNLNLIDGTCPPDYITISDDMIDSLSNLNGDNVRIALSKDYTKDDLLKFRNLTMLSGASSVKFMKIKDDTDIAKVDGNISTKSIDNLFEKWLEYDKPKKLDVDLLKQINYNIINSDVTKYEC